eukprot:TRINITY_DN1071_c0_g2_i1.p1 TRINITY_DN1071_c0_g2~~TRINITY_DN1071_c0_g2_i1.p1  ORF type:complete len:199 (-),score=34.80 TRINITY_DN1071_c0_g2_i1:82-678(-)
MCRVSCVVSCAGGFVPMNEKVQKKNGKKQSPGSLKKKKKKVQVYLIASHNVVLSKPHRLYFFSELLFFESIVCLLDESDELCLLEVLECGGVELNGEVLDDGLDLSLVHRDLGTLQGGHLLSDPGEKDELLALGLIITSDEFAVSIVALVLSEVGLELLDAAVALADQCDDLLRCVGVAEQAPVGVVSAHDLAVGLSK